MKRPSILLFAALTLIGASGCETTGDPNSGGIFWSEKKAQDRLAERERRLGRVEGNTARVARSNDRLESSVERRRRALGE